MDTHEGDSQVRETLSPGEKKSAAAECGNSGKSRTGERTFHTASAVVFLASMVYLYYAHGETMAHVGAFTGVLLSMLILVMPRILRSQEHACDKILHALNKLETRISNSDTAEKEPPKTFIKVGNNQAEMAKLTEEVSLLRKSIMETKKLNDEILALRQEITIREHLLEKWTGAMMEYSDFFHRTLSLPGLSPDYQSAVSKSLKEFSHVMTALGFEIIVPGQGSPFDERIHHAAGIGEASDGVPPGAVIACALPGYRLGADILRKAEVTIARGDKAEGE